MEWFWFFRSELGRCPIADQREARRLELGVRRASFRQIYHRAGRMRLISRADSGPKHRRILFAIGPARHAGMLKANKGDTPVLMSEFLVGYVPGMEAQRFDIDHSAKLIPAGADIVFEVHYTTNGATSEHQTKPA
jgi:hypothetical protein